MPRAGLAAQVSCSVTHLQNIEAGVVPHRGDVLPRLLAALDAAEHDKKERPGRVQVDQGAHKLTDDGGRYATVQDPSAP